MQQTKGQEKPQNACKRFFEEAMNAHTEAQRKYEGNQEQINISIIPKMTTIVTQIKCFEGTLMHNSLPPK